MQPESVVVDALLAVLAVIKGRVEQVGATFSTAFYITHNIKGVECYEGLSFNGVKLRPC